MERRGRIAVACLKSWHMPMLWAWSFDLSVRVWWWGRFLSSINLQSQRIKNKSASLQCQNNDAKCSYEEVLDASNVDAVYMPLPTATHLKWVQLAAGKKKHILLEKPIALVSLCKTKLNLPSAAHHWECKRFPWISLVSKVCIHLPRLAQQFSSSGRWENPDWRDSDILRHLGVEYLWDRRNHQGLQGCWSGPDGWYHVSTLYRASFLTRNSAWSHGHDDEICQRKFKRELSRT